MNTTEINTINLERSERILLPTHLIRFHTIIFRQGDHPSTSLERSLHESWRHRSRVNASYVNKPIGLKRMAKMIIFINLAHCRQERQRGQARGNPNGSEGIRKESHRVFQRAVDICFAVAEEQILERGQAWRGQSSRPTTASHKTARFSLPFMAFWVATSATKQTSTTPKSTTEKKGAESCSTFQRTQHSLCRQKVSTSSAAGQQQQKRPAFAGLFAKTLGAYSAASTATASSARSTSSTRANGALSPTRKPYFRIRT